MIQPYIDIGWWTVPLGGELKRLDTGKKTIPQFSKDWRATYSETRNVVNSAIGGVITGKASGIIAIDCDNATTWAMFRSLDPTNEMVFISKGKNAGTLIYAYNSEVAKNFTIHNDSIELDYYADNGFVYLPTLANKTKVTLGDPLPPVQEMPKTTLALLKQMQATAPPAPVANSRIATSQSFLAPLVAQFTGNKCDYLPGMFRVLTPKKFRSHPDYVATSTLHPCNVYDGDGSSYLSSMSAILGADPSIDKVLYTEAMIGVNELFKEPMPQDRFDSTVLDPMLQERATILGEPIWQYDENWAQFRSLFITKDHSTLEAVYDNINNVYYIVDCNLRSCHVFSKPSRMVEYLQAATTTEKKRPEIVRDLPVVDVVTRPDKPFGFGTTASAIKRELNIFRTTPALNVFYNPEDYADVYKRPETTIRFLKSLVPDPAMRSYLLSFLHTKLQSFEYSPVVLYFLGVPGSGKGTFIRLIEELFGPVPSPTANEFIGGFNGWMEGAYFVELDEYGDTLSSYADKSKAIGTLKAMTGKQLISIRRMREDLYTYTHNVTFILTANNNPLMLDEDDRRVALLSAPNILANQPWVSDVQQTVDDIMSTALDFSYYLATEIEPLSGGEYQKPPMFSGKFEMIADNMPAAQRLAFAFKKMELEYIKDLCLDHACDEVAKAIDENTLTIELLDDLYMEMTNGQGQRAALTRMLRTNSGLTLTRDGRYTRINL